jgi:hypothetical protein
LKEKEIPILTPINQPESEDGSLGFAKMQSLLVIYYYYSVFIVELRAFYLPAK